MIDDRTTDMHATIDEVIAALNKMPDAEIGKLLREYLKTNNEEGWVEHPIAVIAITAEAFRLFVNTITAQR